MSKVFSIVLAVWFTFFLYRRVIRQYISKIKELRAMNKNALVLEGTVIDFKVDKDTDGAVSYLRIIEYNVEGRVLKSILDEPVTEMPEVGVKLRLFCNKDRPDFIVTDVVSVLEKYYTGLFFLFIMILMMFAVAILTIVE